MKKLLLSCVVIGLLTSGRAWADPTGLTYKTGGGATIPGSAILTPMSGTDQYGNPIYGPPSSTSPLPVAIVPVTPASALAPVVSTAAETAHVLKASGCPCVIVDLTAVVGAVSGWVLLLDSAIDPGNGAVTPKWFFPVSSDGTKGGFSKSWSEPLKFTTGITVVFSSTGPFTETQSATAAFSAQVQ